MSKTKREWAHEIASRGIRIVPLHHTESDGRCTCGNVECTSPGKHPTVSAWPTVATTDHEIIDEWFNNNPKMNYGSMAGAEVFIIDLDVKKGDDGYQTYADLMHLNKPDIAGTTFSVKTPSGGMHLYTATDKAYSNSAKTTLGSGIDTRSGNGFVVGPGSSLFIEDELGDYYEQAYEVAHDAPFEPIPAIVKVRLQEAMVRADDAGEAVHEVLIDSPGAIDTAITWLKNRPPAVEGSGGNNHTFVTATVLQNYGLSEEKALEVMLEYWNDTCEPPWDPEELKGIVENGFKYAKKKAGSFGAGLMEFAEAYDNEDSILPKNLYDDTVEPERGLFDKILSKLYSSDKFLDLDLHYDFIIDGWLPSKNYTIMLGKRGGGKTTIMVDMICHIASDTDWWGTDVEKGWTVVYIAGEDDAGVKERIEAWCVEHKDICTVSDNGQKFYLPYPERLRVYPLPINLMDKEVVNAYGDAIMSVLKDERVLFVVDTWQRMTSMAEGGQSDDVSMQQAIDNLESLCRKFKGPCIIAAHPPKANTETMAGSGIIENRSDAIWTIDAEAKAGVRDIVVSRIKGAPEQTAKSIAFKAVEIDGYDRFDRRRRSVVVDYRGSTEVAKGQKEKRVSESSKDAQLNMARLAADVSRLIGNYDPEFDKGKVIANDIARVLCEVSARSVPKTQYDLEWSERAKQVGFTEYELSSPVKLANPHYERHGIVKMLNAMRDNNYAGFDLQRDNEWLVWKRKGKTFELHVEKRVSVNDGFTDEDEEARIREEI